jgi:biotin synthase
MSNPCNDPVQELKEKILSGGTTTKEEAMFLAEQPLEKLAAAADEIRRKFCGNSFDICTIINGKSGRCSEDCKYCAQSSHYQTEVQEYPLLGADEIVRQAAYNDERGVLRYSIVTSGRKLSDQEVDRICASIRAVRRQTGVAVCVSLGLLSEEQFQKLKAAGTSRVHCNLESSRNYFPSVCTTHTYDEKIATLQAAKHAGLSICCGGIMGLGETMEDRIDMVLTARELGVKSIPVNILNPIQGTPYENNRKLPNKDVCRIVAVFRFLIPDASIRMAGGRELLPDKGRACFSSGANAAISGDMLTTAGITIETDMQMLKELGYQAALWNE